MRNFYQSKGDNRDTIPIVLPLERRHTMETNGEGRREQSYLPTRAFSASSLDKLSVSPTIPRAKTGDVQKSLSSDIQSKDRLKANKIVSETDLSSSWLYKTMQASINARFKSPRKSPSVQQIEYIEPITLKDPKLKPIPVKSSAERTSSCLCYFATMIAIGVCTVGFLASIAGIIYLEVFSSRNITSLHVSETQVDLSDVDLDSLESHNDLTTFGLDAEGQLADGASAVLEKSSVNDGPRGVIGRFLLTGDPDVTELVQYVNSTDAKIKFRDAQTIIYEMNTSDEESSNSVGDTKDTEQSGFNETKGESFKEEKSSVDVEKSENLSHSNVEDVDNKVITVNTEISSTKLSDFIVDENLVEKDSINSKGDGTINSEMHPEPEIASLMSTEAESTEATEIHTKNFEHEISPNPETNSFFLSNEELVHSGKMNTNEQSSSSKWSDFSSTERVQGSRAPNHNDKVSSFVEYVDHTVKNEQDVDSTMGVLGSQTPQHGEEVSSSVEYVDHTVKSKNDVDSTIGAPGSLVLQHGGKVSSSVEYVDHADENEHDVDSMVMTVDEPEPEEVSTDSFLERNGEIPVPIELPSSRSFSFMSNGSEKSGLPKKPVDLKVSLAEAMKHLHALDTQNKLVTSRKKTTPSQVVWTKRRMTTTPRNEFTTTERMSYLQKVRLMLYKQLQ